MKNPIGSLNPLKFISIMQERSKRFKKAASTPIPEEYPVNALAKKIHPAVQYAKISEVEVHSEDCKTFTFVPDVTKGTEQFAFFSAGQYLTVFLDIDGVKVTRAYSICSSPNLTKGTEQNGITSESKYQITVKGVKSGLVSSYILSNWKAGDRVELSAPEGHFEYVSLRDAPTVIGIAGGSGITPFLSMARAIAEGTEQFTLSLLYGSRNKDSILFKKEFDELQKLSDKIKVIHVLSDDASEFLEPGFEKGFITADLIKKYAPENEPYSVFLCGPQVMYNFAGKELEKLNLEKKYVRYELFGELHSAKAQKGYADCAGGQTSENSEISVTVSICGETRTVRGSADDTIMQILEKNGIAVPARCRSGECGWCHSYLKSGKIFIPEGMDYRRKADEKNGFIHPCCTFALSDIEIEVPPAK